MWKFPNNDPPLQRHFGPFGVLASFELKWNSEWSPYIAHGWCASYYIYLLNKPPPLNKPDCLRGAGLPLVMSCAYDVLRWFLGNVGHSWICDNVSKILMVPVLSLHISVWELDRLRRKRTFRIYYSAHSVPPHNGPWQINKIILFLSKLKIILLHYIL